MYLKKVNQILPRELYSAVLLGNQPGSEQYFCWVSYTEERPPNPFPSQTDARRVTTVGLEGEGEHYDYNLICTSSSLWGGMLRIYYHLKLLLPKSVNSESVSPSNQILLSSPFHWINFELKAALTFQ